MNYSYLFGILLLFINIIYAMAVDDNMVKNEEDHYLIFVNNIYGEFEIFSESKYEKREESHIFVESLLDEINDLIIENIDTYQHPEKLEAFETTSKLRKRNNGQPLFTSNSEYAYPISSIKNTVIIFSYLSKALIPQILAMDSVIDCIPNEKSFSIDSYYSEKDIINETHWSGLKVQEDAEIHLSFLSQGIVNTNRINEYDNNFYYPSSAGEGINIVILDTNFHFGYSELKSNGGRTVQCVAIDDNGKAGPIVIDGKCNYHKKNHGQIVSDMAGGLLNGVAKRANIYGVSIPIDSGGGIEIKDMINGLQYVYEKTIVRNKTVVNLSLGGQRATTDRYYNQYKEYIDGIIGKGGIVVASAGNNKISLTKSTVRYVPCEFDNVICVGGLNSTSVNNFYNISGTSNYGSSVDIYAPGNVKAIINDNGSVKSVVDSGTSFSTPLVTGIVATYMSEHSGTQFTYEKIKNFLKSNATYKSNNSKTLFANNGKHIVYSASKK